ncbi:EGFL7 protein, partial [Chloroceryle aenea]|nr:EGFL7 protein [Chloroceryle aenea]
MHPIGCLLSGLFFILSTTSTGSFAQAGRRVCATTPQSRAAAYTESHVQPIYQPYLTTCQGHRLCSTYRASWPWTGAGVSCGVCAPCVCAPCVCTHPWWLGREFAPPELPSDTVLVSGPTALCWVPCQNGGSCVFPGRCSCPPGWMGPACQTAPRRALTSLWLSQCSQPSCAALVSTFSPCHCSTLGRLAADDRTCQPLVPAPEPETSSRAGPSSEIKEEMKVLKSRVEALEQKLQLVLAPFHDLMPSAPEDVSADPISRLSHSLQQLDRIDSLSEQISFLEERLETCKC